MECIIFIGIQGSGKSTFYKNHLLDTHIRLGMDMLNTRYRESLLVSACINAKQSFVVDNTNPSKSDRKRYIDALGTSDFKIKGYFFQSKILECLERNNLRSGKAKIPEIGIKGTHKKLEIPSYDEGFDELYFVSLNNKEFKIEEWKNEI